MAARSYFCDSPPLLRVTIPDVVSAKQYILLHSTVSAATVALSTQVYTASNTQTIAIYIYSRRNNTRKLLSL